MRVPLLSRNDLEQLLLTREALEGIACRQAAEHMTGPEIRQLRETARHIEKLLEEGLGTVFANGSNYDFYGQIAARFVDGLIPHRAALVDVPGIDAIVAMVGEGIGVSVLPKLRPVHLEAHAVREIDLGRNAPVRIMAMVRRKAETDHRALDVVEAVFVAAADQLAMMHDKRTVT